MARVVDKYAVAILHSIVQIIERCTNIGHRCLAIVKVLNIAVRYLHGLRNLGSRHFVQLGARKRRYEWVFVCSNANNERVAIDAWNQWRHISNTQCDRSISSGLTSARQTGNQRCASLHIERTSAHPTRHPPLVRVRFNQYPTAFYRSDAHCRALIHLHKDRRGCQLFCTYFCWAHHAGILRKCGWRYKCKT